METWDDGIDFYKTSRFKSYYVVWKLYYTLYIILLYICLNRTMQYGNLDRYKGEAMADAV